MSCALYLCCLILAGYPVAAGMARRANWMETTALTMCMGPGIAGILLIFLSMLGVRPVEAEILAISATFAVAAIVIWKFGPKREPIESCDDRPAMWWRILCFAGIGYGVFALCKDVFIDPVIEWDAFAIWQLKGLVLAVLPLHPRPAYFSNLNLSYSHLRYPLLVPMIAAGMHAMTGRLDDFGKMISLLWYPAMLLAVFATVRRMNGTAAALAATALLACAAPITHFAGSGTAEMAITAFFACSVICILRWHDTGLWGYIFLAGFFGAWMAWTKNEGLAMATANVVVVAASGGLRRWKRNLAAAAIMALIAAALYTPWIVYSWGLPRTDEDYAGRLNLHQFLASLPQVVTVLIGFGWELINWQDWGLFWIIGAALLVVERKRLRDSRIRILTGLVALQLAIYVPVLAVTNWKLEDLMAVTLGRLFMHAAPAAAILIGGLWPAWVGGNKSAQAKPEAGSLAKYAS